MAKTKNVLFILQISCIHLDKYNKDLYFTAYYIFMQKSCKYEVELFKEYNG